MTTELVALSVAAHDPARMARFWSALLGWPTSDDGLGGILLEPTDDTGFALRLVSTDEPRHGRNQMHLDLTSTSLEDQRRTVARALEHGGRHLDVGQLPEEEHVVMADLEGNEFCVIEPGNAFLADCGFVGAVAGDGTQQVGYFWSRALGWPLVWDQDEETAIRSPLGGPKITWGGPPLDPRAGPNRLRFELAPSAGEDADAAVDRLVALGASRSPGPGEPGRVELTDPDGNELSLLTGR